MARAPRNYKAEEARRNELARQRGYTSRAQQRRRIEKGVVPPLRPRRAPITDPVEKSRVTRSPRSASNARLQDDESQRWSNSHSKQDVTRFNRNWNAARRDAYFRAFVAWWDLPNDERDFGPTYDYMIEYGDADEHAYDLNPYQR